MTHPRDLVLAATTLDRVAFISPCPGGEDPGPGHGIQGMCAAMAGAGARWLLARPLRAVCGVGGAVFFFDGVGLRHGCATAAVELKHVPDGLQPKMLLPHFTRVAPYFGATLQNDDDLTVPRMMMFKCCGFRFVFAWFV